MKVLVLGIGNTLLSDEGIGIHVVNALQGCFAPEDQVELMDGGTLSFTLAGFIAEAEALIVVDAAQLKAKPGTLQIFAGEAMDRFLIGHRSSSVHEVGLIDLMAIAQLSGQWPINRVLIAIQPDKIGWGELPTNIVAAVIPTACQHIQTIVNSWNKK